MMLSVVHAEIQTAPTVAGKPLYPSLHLGRSSSVSSVLGSLSCMMKRYGLTILGASSRRDFSLGVIVDFDSIP